MYKCKHSTTLGERSHHGHCDIDPSISVGEGWQSGYEEDTPEMYHTARSSNWGWSDMHTPKRGVAQIVPGAPLRQRIARDPNLSAGVAIVQRRIDFDSSTFDESGSEFRPSFRSTRYPDRSHMSQRSAAYLRQSAPRMTKMTPGGKCLRM